MMAHFIQDLAFAVRKLRKSPGFTIAVILTLGVGIGINVAIYSIIHAVLLSELPYPAPDRLVAISETSGGVVSPTSYPDYLDWRAAQRSFEDIAVSRRDDFNLTGDGEPERFSGLFVTASYFRVLKVSPKVGRIFFDKEDSEAGVSRYNLNGSLDTSFGDGGIVTTTFPEGSYAFDVALQTDGKIIAAGTVFVAFDPGESSNTDFALARYNPDGTPDATFGNGGQVSTDFVGFEDDAFSVLIQPDGKIVAVGSANDPATFYDFAAARYLSNGTLDTTFGVAGKVHTDFGDQNFDRARSACASNPMAGLSLLDSLSLKTEESRILPSRGMTPAAFSTPTLVPTG